MTYAAFGALPAGLHDFVAGIGAAAAPGAADEMLSQLHGALPGMLDDAIAQARPAIRAEAQKAVVRAAGAAYGLEGDAARTASKIAGGILVGMLGIALFVRYRRRR